MSFLSSTLGAKAELCGSHQDNALSTVLVELEYDVDWNQIASAAGGDAYGLWDDGMDLLNIATKYLMAKGTKLQESAWLRKSIVDFDTTVAASSRPAFHGTNNALYMFSTPEPVLCCSWFFSSTSLDWGSEKKKNLSKC